MTNLARADSRPSSALEDDFWQQIADKHSFAFQLAHMQRFRERKDETGASNDYHDDLNHGTSQLVMNFKSGWLHDYVGFNFSAFAAADVTSDDDLPRNIENEFAFAGNKWSRENTHSAENGASISRAVLKLRSAAHHVRLKAGIAPMNVPGIFGVNWSFQPGSYRGVQIKYTPQDWAVTYAWADQYKAPWYKQTQHFSKRNAWDETPAAGDNRIDFIHGVAVRYQPEAASYQLQFGYGRAKDYLQAYHFKWSWQLPVEDGLSLSYLFYGTDSDNDTGFDLYQGMAWQQGIRALLNVNRWTFRAELMNNKAEGLGTYLPRMTRGYANSQGSNEFWWDSRSDWNNDGETAVFAGVWYELPQQSGLWQLGASTAYGWGATRWVEQQQDHAASTGEESAWNLDLAYSVRHGMLHGLSMKLHYTHYRNHQDHLGSFYYANMFTSERDVKLTMTIPFT
ncbi:OprD family outer membrane porin [Neiella marina]|uniref:OprD family outer membrane porin n=1 Tax=Neiella holothuriorum TaxID=2870530 RepID=A0ABS7EIS3_9GAMM|nr:OprD family outer membrane porin [Neiella holothuriorum]MBW8192253.1 OprD family outer membrane porin [Neiella holothuriorum]